MLKACRICGNPFEPRPSQIKAYDWRCQPCQTAFMNRYNAERRRLGLPYQVEKSAATKRRAAQRQREYLAVPENRQRRREWFRAYHQRPEVRIKLIARWALKTAVEAGKITRGKCALCGNAVTDGHHTDYTKPLLVIWLCKTCHRKQHPRTRKLPRYETTKNKNT